MAHADYEAVTARFASEPVLAVRITVPGGKSGSDVELVFVEKSARPIHTTLGIDLLPYLLQAGGAGVRIEPDKIGSWTGSKTLLFLDPPEFEAFSSTDVYIETGPTYFQTFQLAFPDWHKAKVEVLHGYIDPDIDALSKFEPVHLGLLTDMRFRPDGTVEVEVDDVFDFEKKIEVPTQISDDNTLAAAIGTGSGEEKFTVDIPDEFPDPKNDFPSADYLAPVLVINRGETNEERVLLDRKDSSDLLVCCENHLADTEKYEVASTAWSSSGGTATDDSDVGPFGFVNATLFEGSGSSLAWDQTTGHNAAGNRHFAIWLKEHPDDPGITIRLTIRDQTGTPIAYTNDVTLEDRWIRFQVEGDFSSGTGKIEVEFGYTSGGPYKFYATQSSEGQTLNRGFYVANGSSAGGLIAGRGQFGTTVQSHIVGETLDEEAEYRGMIDNTDGLNEAFVARDLVNRMLVPSSGFSTDFSTFDSTFSTLGGTGRFRRTVVEPRPATELLAECQEQGNIIVYGDKDGEVKCRPAFRPDPTPIALTTLSDLEDFVEAGPGTRALWIESNKQSRITVVVIHFDLQSDASGVPYSGDEPEHYAEHIVITDPTAEGPGMRSRKIRTIFAKWLYEDLDARALGENYLARFRKGARKAGGKLRFQRSLDVEVGKTIVIDSDKLAEPDVSNNEAVRGGYKFQVVEINYPAGNDDLEIEFLEAIQARFGHISEAGFPDYDDAPAETIDFYAHVGEAGTNFVGVNDDPGFVIVAG